MKTGSDYFYSPEKHRLSDRADGLGFHWCVLDWPDNRLLRVRDEGGGFIDHVENWTGYIDVEVVAISHGSKEACFAACLQWARDHPPPPLGSDRELESANDN